MAKKLTMKEIQELAKKKTSGGDNKQRFKNTDIYPFWLMQEDEIAKVRFLPDKNKENVLPFVEKLEHKLTIDGNVRKVPCPKMYDHKCPICDLSQEYYKSEGDDSKNGKYYYRDRMHLARALIIEDPLQPDSETGETYVGKVVTLQLGFQIHEKIMEQLGTFFDDEDMPPWDFEEGYNFNIKKVKQGKYHKYDIGSSFDRKPSAIPDEYLENIEIKDLRDLLPEEIDYDKANEFLEKHMSGGVADSDSLESKKSSTSENSDKRAAMLSRLEGSDDDDEDDNDEQDEAKKVVRELAEEAEEDDLSSDAYASKDDDDEDDDDEDAELQAIINRKRRKKS